MEKKVKQYFDNYPHSNVCYSSSDGFIFVEKNHASAHGNTLKDKEVKEYKRADYFSEAELAEQQEAIKRAELEAAGLSQNEGKKNDKK